MNTEHDDQEIYCRMLGHPLRFSYCRSTDGNAPCRKIIDCWYQRFPVEKFLHDNFPKSVLEKIGAPLRDKVLTLLELIEQADRSRNNSG